MESAALLSERINSVDTDAAELVITQAVGALRSHLAAPADGEARTVLRQSLHAAANAVARLPRHPTPDRTVRSAAELLRRLCENGVHDEAGSLEIAAARSHANAHGWPGTLAAMLLAGAWQWTDTPALADVPDWLWGDYAGWLFATPRRFTVTADADAFAAHVLARLEELSRWVDRNPGSSAVTAAFERFLKCAPFSRLVVSDSDLRRHAELHARLIARCLRRPSRWEAAALPASGRRLRVGFVVLRFDSQPDTEATLPLFADLDPERFEVMLFAIERSGSGWEIHAQKNAQAFAELPAELSAQLSTLRAAELDIAVFTAELAGDTGPLACLAAHRVATLQISAGATLTTGFAAIDLFVTSSFADVGGAAAQFSERLALVPLPVRTFDRDGIQSEPGTEVTRVALGLPADGPVLVSAAALHEISRDTMQTWAGILAAVPAATLLVQPLFAATGPAYPVELFLADFAAVLRSNGVDASRVVLSGAELSSRCDLAEILRCGDVALDPFPGQAESGLLDPLSSGVPVVTRPGQSLRSRVRPALLRSLGLDELIAADEPDYRALVTGLLTDPSRRAAVRARVEAVMDAAPLAVDTLAASDAFGEIIERAHAELTVTGAEGFRIDRTVLCAADAGSDLSRLAAVGGNALAAGDAKTAAVQARAILRMNPADRSGRHLYGCALLALGRADRAAKYLLAATRDGQADGLVWFHLAQALRAGQQMRSAIQALETSLRLDPRALDGWLMLIELADEVGAAELSGQALHVARELAPADRRVLALGNGR